MRELEKWVIVPTGVSSMCIEGRCAKTGAFVTTEDIQRCLGDCRVVAVGGVCYQLRGHLDWDACFEANIPLHILDKFKNGVPPNWKRIIYGWPTKAPDDDNRCVKRRTSGRRHGSSTATRPESVPGTPRSVSTLDGRRNVSGEQAELRNLPRIAPGTEEQRARQAERGKMSDNQVDGMIKENQLQLKNLSVLLNPLPKFPSFKKGARKFANKQICSTPVRSAPVPVEKRPTRACTSRQKGSLNRKRCSNCDEALVVAQKSSSPKQKKGLMSQARAKTEDAPVLVANRTASSEVAACSRNQPPAPKLQSVGKVPARKTSGAAMVLRRQSSSCPGLVQLGESSKAQVHVHSTSVQRCQHEALRSKEPNQEMAAEPGASERCKEKKRTRSMTAGNPAAKAQQAHTSAHAVAITITKSRRRSLQSAKQGHKEKKSKQSSGRCPESAKFSRKQPHMDPLTLCPGKHKGRAVNLSSSPPRRELRSTRSFALGCTRSGLHYARETTALVSRNSRSAIASSVRRKLELTSSLSRGNSSWGFEDSSTSEVQKKAGCPKQPDLVKHVAKETHMSSPKRLSRNRTESGICSEAKATSAEETVKKRRRAMQGRNTQPVTTADNTSSWGKKEDEAVQAKKKGTNSLHTCTGRAQRQIVKNKKCVPSVSCSIQHLKSPKEVGPRKTRAQTSQPNHISTPAASNTSLGTVKKGTLKQQVPTSRKKGTKKRATFTAQNDVGEVQKPPVKVASKAESSKMRASNLSVASVPATTELLRKADERRTPQALDVSPTPNTAESRYPTREWGQSEARPDVAKAGHASGATAPQLPKMPSGALKRKREAGAGKPDCLTDRKKPNKEEEVQKVAASPRAVTIGGPRRASAAVRNRKQAGTSKLSHTLKTTERVMAAGAQKEAPRAEDRVGERNTSINKRPEANDTPKLPAQNFRHATTARTNFKLHQKAGSSKTSAKTSNLGMPSGPATTEKPNEGDRGQTPLRLQQLHTSQTSGSQHSELTQKARSSKTQSCTVQVGHATEAIATQPQEALLLKDNAMALRQKRESGTEESNSSLGQKKPNGENNGTEKPDASTGRGEPHKANVAQKPPPSGSRSPQVSSELHLEPTPEELLRKKSSKPRGQTARTGSATEAVQRKPKESRTKKGDKVQKPGVSDVKSVRELAPEAGPSRTPMGPKKGGKAQKPASSGAQGSECEFTLPAGPSRTPALDVGQAPNPSADTRFTEALLAITARKGTKKRKAQVKQLTEALAARDKCDDIYGATGAPVDVVGDIFDEDPWAQMSDLRASSIGTPTPNSPHVSPGKSCFSFSSDHSAAMSVSPPYANAILLGIRGKKAPAPLPSSAPKPAYNRKKHLSVGAWAKELKVLGEEMERRKINANCAESSNEDSDTESSASDKLPPLLL